MTIDNDIAAILERRRRAEDKSLKELVNEALRRGLKELASPAKAREPFRTRTVSVGRILIGNLDDISEVLAVAEREDYR